MIAKINSVIKKENTFNFAKNVCLLGKVKKEVYRLQIKKNIS